MRKWMNILMKIVNHTSMINTSLFLFLDKSRKISVFILDYITRLSNNPNINVAPLIHLFCVKKN